MERDHLDALYSLAPSDFTAARNALAKQLKADGRADAAAAVSGLRKPTVTAWALNEVARGHADAVADLFAAQREIERADSGEALRRAGGRRQDLISSLVRLAVEVLDAAGHDGRVARDKIQMTLLALATDPEAAAAFQGGYLTTDVQPTSNWDLALTQGAGDVARDEEAAGSTGPTARDQKELDRLVERADQLEKRAAAAAARLEEVREEAKAAAAAAKKARAEADRKAADLGAD